MNTKRHSGFTLVEMILVTLIISALFVMFMGYTTRKGEEFRRDKAAAQIQQALNAGLVFYIDNSRWPNCTFANGCKLNFDTDEEKNCPACNELQSYGYLPKVTVKTPWEGNIFHSPPTETNPNFSICIAIPASNSSATTADSIAGRLPMAITSTVEVGEGGIECEPAKITPGECKPNEACTVMASVSPPGQNINNARSINFAGLYRNGGCVPVPKCPSLGNNPMQPAIIVVPSSVSGLNKGYTPGAPVFPIESFTAYATEKATVTSSTGPNTCVTAEPATCAEGVEDATNKIPAGKIDTTGETEYWRVCLSISTEEGTLSGEDWPKESGTIVAFTRCVPQDEPFGSNINVFDSF